MERKGQDREAKVIESAEREVVDVASFDDEKWREALERSKQA